MPDKLLQFISKEVQEEHSDGPTEPPDTSDGAITGDQNTGDPDEQVIQPGDEPGEPGEPQLVEPSGPDETEPPGPAEPPEPGEPAEPTESDVIDFSQFDGKKIRLKFKDGETEREELVDSDEAMKGYMRQSDYTRGKQELSEREQEMVQFLNNPDLFMAYARQRGWLDPEQPSAPGKTPEEPKKESPLSKLDLENLSENEKILVEHIQKQDNVIGKLESSQSKTDKVIEADRHKKDFDQIIDDFIDNREQFGAPEEAFPVVAAMVAQGQGPLKKIGKRYGTVEALSDLNKFVISLVSRPNIDKYFEDNPAEREKMEQEIIEKYLDGKLKIQKKTAAPSPGGKTVAPSPKKSIYDEKPKSFADVRKFGVKHGLVEPD